MPGAETREQQDLGPELVSDKEDTAWVQMPPAA